MECENQRRRVTGSRSAVRAAARSSPAAQGENAPQTRLYAGRNILNTNPPRARKGKRIAFEMDYAVDDFMMFVIDLNGIKSFF